MKVKHSEAKSSFPRYGQIKMELVKLIESGAFKPGTDFYTLSEISEKYNVSQITARRAISELAGEGYVNTSRGKKPQVSSFHPNQNLFDSTKTAVFFYSKSETATINYKEMPWTNTISSAIQKKILEKGALCTMVPACNSDDALNKLELIKKDHDAFICLSPSFSEKLIPLFENIKKPYVTFQPDSDKAECNFVAADYYGGSSDVAKIAFSKGYQSFLYIGYKFTEDPRKMRGFLEALLRKRVSPENIYIRSLNSVDDKASGEVLKSFLKREKILFPLAVYSFADSLSLELLNSALELGFKVPEDIGIAGSTGILSAEQSSPSLTTMQIPMEKMGAISVDMIFEMLVKKNLRIPGVTLETKIIERQSL